MNSTLQVELQACLEIQNNALGLGYNQAPLVWTSDILFDSRTRLKCRQNLCGHFEKNFMCPPHIPDWTVYQEANQRFRLALLLQKAIPIEGLKSGPEKLACYDKYALEHMLTLVNLEKSAFSLGLLYAISACGGACKHCKPCQAVHPEIKACPFPHLSRPSMEAMGIDVVATCRRSGLLWEFLPDRVLLTGLLYLL